MALSLCASQVDVTGRELIEHGKTPFPIACYHDDLVKAAVPWHWHEELEAAVVTEGKAVIAVDSRRYTVKAGEGFFINSGVLHGCWNADTSACRFHSMCFHARLVGGSVDSIYWMNYLRPLMENRSLKGFVLKRDIGWHREILEEVERTWQYCVDETPGYEFEVRSALSRVIFQIAGHVSGAVSPPSAKALRDGDRIKRMLQYIHDHYSEEITLGEIADSASISESESLRCFRSMISTTPVKYLKTYRLQRAAELLKNTEAKVVDIGVQCGFQDMSYFAKSFREVYGCTPSQFQTKTQAAVSGHV